MSRSTVRMRSRITRYWLIGTSSESKCLAHSASHAVLAAAISSLLKFSSAYLKMLLKKQAGYQPDQPISAELAKTVAAQVNRPWPPAAAG